MPSGKVHDRITVATAALSLPAFALLFPHQAPAAFAAGVVGYVFGGLWMSDDLDTHSVAYRRWGPFRFLWYPYQKMVPHRHWISHGIGVGPLIRVLYFTIAAWLLARVALWVVNMWLAPVNREGILRHAAVAILRFVATNDQLAFACLVGLIVAGIAHTGLDAVNSFIKKVW
jgi:uncharacterized metal-binding protein